MASGIISVAEGLEGFSNQGLMTVMVLFVVAEGISRTGALDWYMAKLLGRPKSNAAAQLRLMIPIATVSAFLNNTPIVVIMIPIVQKWAKNIRLSVQQLLIPLSFASILGGTCTLIGTSTNLIVVGLLYATFPDDPSVQIGLFDLGAYGVPIAMVGITYTLLVSPFLLPGGRGRASRQQQSSPLEQAAGDDDLLLGARLTSWSPAAGRSVKRSGLRDTGGIYLVSVHRAATGHVHRAVSGDFVLNAGDILYFTGLVESFGEFCNEHGLEVVTNEIQEQEPHVDMSASYVADENGNGDANNITKCADQNGGDVEEAVGEGENPKSGGVLRSIILTNTALPTVNEDSEQDGIGIPKEVGCTKETFLEADDAERLRSISRMADLIHGFVPPSQEATLEVASKKEKQRKRTAVEPLRGADPANIVVAIEKDLVVAGVNAQDRPGLLLDISKGLLRLNLQLRHTEAAVVDDRSVSIWRCDSGGIGEDKQEIPIPDLEEIWSVLSALLSQERGVEAIKQRGLRVIRARVTKESKLINRTAAEVEFQKRYRAAIVAVQTGGQNVSHGLSTIRFNEGDVLILQAKDDSPLLKKPPADFYLAKRGMSSRESSVQSLVNLITRRKSNQSLDMLDNDVNPREDAAGAEITVTRSDDDKINGTFFIPSAELDGESENPLDVTMEADLENAASSADAGSPDSDMDIWRDLQVLFSDGNEDGEGNRSTVTREFLTAMEVSKNAKWAGKSARQVGFHKLPDLFLVSIDRPVTRSREERQVQAPHQVAATPSVNSASVGEGSEIATSIRTEHRAFVSIDQDEPLKQGDILWFSGAASVVGDLRKIPGLVSYEDEEVKKMNEHVHDRRLVQAVISRNGPLVGKTVKETRFRTRYGAAVIAVHREGKRVHEHPGNVKLQAGDVLLLEAGPSFLAKTGQNDRSFALLAEVENSAPPRLRLLIPALVLAVLMLVVYVVGWLSLLVSALCASILMVLFGILSEQEVRDALNWEIYVIIACAFGIGSALVNSGVAGAIANFLVGIGTGVGLGDAGLYGAIYFATFLISNVVTNNAAAALIFPIAMEAAVQTNTDKVLMSFALMLGASASFMTPYGYTTNLLIYGPGGYKYTDFLYFGFPMQIVLWVLSTVFLVLRPWYLSWIFTGAILLATIAFLVFSEQVCRAIKSPARAIGIGAKSAATASVAVAE